jgi:hypothetical protein
MKYEQKIELLAELRHEAFCNITKHVIKDGVVPKQILEGWRQHCIPYKDLPYQVKNRRREWARMALKLMIGQAEKPKTRRALMDVIQHVNFPIERRQLIKEIETKLKVKRASAYRKIKYLVQEGKLVNWGKLIKLPGQKILVEK